MLNLIWVSTKCRFGIYRRGPSALFFELLYIGLMMAIVLASAAHDGAAALHRSAIGFFTWMLFAMVSMSGVEAITGAAASGTLEKMLSGPMRHVTIILGEVISSAIVGLLRWIIVLAVLAGTLRIPVPFSAPALVTLLLLIAFFVALAVGISAAGLVVRRTLNISSYLQLGMLGLALLASSTSTFARPLELFPFTLAIRLLEAPTITNQDIAVLAFGTFLTAIASSAVFVYADRRALRLGLLSVV